MIHSETFREEMIAVGERLIDLQQVETELSKCYAEQPGTKLLEQWRVARRTVEGVAEEYVRAIRRYNEAVQGQSLSDPASDQRAAMDRQVGTCTRCGGRLKRIHRSLLQRFRCVELYFCRQCLGQEFIPRFTWSPGGGQPGRRCLPLWGNSRPGTHGTNGIHA